MPIEFVKVLKENRASFDEHEIHEDYLQIAEKVYMELCDIYDMKKTECVRDGQIRSLQDINNELYEYIVNMI